MGINPTTANCCGLDAKDHRSQLFNYTINQSLNIKILNYFRQKKGTLSASALRV